MYKLLLISMLSLTLTACDRLEKPYNSSSQEQDYDNTGKNVRDRDAAARTPMNQSESETDRTITQRIRQAIVADRALSSDAKNIKIITERGVVTLRGPVVSSQEKDAIARKANDVQGVVRVDNQIDIIRDNR